MSRVFFFLTFHLFILNKARAEVNSYLIFSTTDCHSCYYTINNYLNADLKVPKYIVFNESFTGQGFAILNRLFTFDSSRINIVYSDSIFNIWNLYNSQSCIVIARDKIPLFSFPAREWNNNELLLNSLVETVDSNSVQFEIGHVQDFYYMNNSEYVILDNLYNRILFVKAKEIYENPIISLMINDSLKYLLTNEEYRLHIEYSTNREMAKMFPPIKYSSLYCFNDIIYIIIEVMLPEQQGQTQDANSIILKSRIFCIEYSKSKRRISRFRSFVEDKLRGGYDFETSEFLVKNDSYLYFPVFKDKYSASNLMFVEFDITETPIKQTGLYKKICIPEFYISRNAIYEFTSTIRSENFIMFVNAPYLINILNNRVYTLKTVPEIDSLDFSKNVLFNYCLKAEPQGNSIKILSINKQVGFNLFELDLDSGEIISSKRIGNDIIERMNSKPVLIDGTTIAFISKTSELEVVKIIL